MYSEDSWNCMVRYMKHIICATELLHCIQETGSPPPKRARKEEMTREQGKSLWFCIVKNLYVQHQVNAKYT